MNKKKLVIILGLILSFSSFSLQAADTLDIKLRFFEGTREGQPQPPQFVISSYLQPTVTASIQSKYELPEEISRIKKVFNLREVGLITEAGLSWTPEKSKKIFQIFRLNGKEYMAQIQPVIPLWKHQFRIEVYEQGKKEKICLLDTEIILPQKNIAVFGFENKQGKPYFLSFHVESIAGQIAAPPPPHPKEEIDESEEGAVRAIGNIKPPKLIKKVDPDYSEEAKKAHVEGYVIIEAKTDKEGNVVGAKVLRRKSPILAQAAVDAVKQWKYEPMYIKGEPHGVLFTVTVRFKLKDKELKTPDEFVKNALRVKGEIRPPKLIKRVEPVYPEEARKEGIGGIVILEARTDEQGGVEAVRVVKSESSLLNQAAVEAVKQWKYEPFIKEGKPRRLVFSVTVKFMLKDKEEEDFEKGAVKIEGELEPPKLLKKVEPVYPEEARKAGVSGIVILNVKTDELGRVIKVKILKSPDPLLDKAAVNAVMQWIYEPFIHKGKPRPTVFTVTVKFKLR